MPKLVKKNKTRFKAEAVFSERWQSGTNYLHSCPGKRSVFVPVKASTAPSCLFHVCESERKKERKKEEKKER